MSEEENTEAPGSGHRVGATVGLAAFLIGLWGPFCFLQFLLAALLLGLGLVLILAAGHGLEVETFPRIYWGSWVVLAALTAAACFGYYRTSRDHAFHWRFILGGVIAAGLGIMGALGALLIERDVTKLVQILAYGLTDFLILTVFVLIVDATVRLSRRLWQVGRGSPFGAGMLTAGGPLLAFIGLPLFGLGLVSAHEMIDAPAYEEGYVESLRRGFIDYRDSVKQGLTGWSEARAELAEHAPTPAAETVDVAQPSLPPAVEMGGKTRKRRRKRYPPPPEGLDCESPIPPNFRSCLIELESSPDEGLAPKPSVVRFLRQTLPENQAVDRADAALDRVCSRRCDLAVDRERLISYYWRAAYHAGIDYFREKRELGFDEERDHPPGQGCTFDPEAQMHAELRDSAVQEAFEQFAPEEQRALELCVFRTVREAARELGLTRSTMGARCKALKKRLRCESEKIYGPIF